jgi:hypothetical protein
MNSRERCLTALRGGVPDRVPIWAWGIAPWLGPVHPTIQRVVDAYLERGDIIEWWSPGSGVFLTASDQVLVSRDRRPCSLRGFEEHWTTYETPAGPLTEADYASVEGKPGYRRKYLIESETDAEKLLSIPYVPVRPDCSSFFELDGHLGDRGLLMVAVPSDPMYYVNNLIGSENFALWSIENRALIGRLVAVFAQRVRDWVEWVLDQGVGPLYGYVGPELCIPPLQSPRDFEEWVVGPDREINDLIRGRGGIAFVHCHGKVGAVLEAFVRMHTNALHPIEPPPMGDVTLEDAKRRVGRDLCIVGNIQHHELCTMPTEELRCLVARTIRTGMEGGGFILSPTATPFGWPEMTELEQRNWLAMLDVALTAG